MRVLAMQSGTSADAIDVAVVDISAMGDRAQVQVVAYREIPWPSDLRTDLLSAIATEPSDAGFWTRLDTRAGQAFADAAQRVADEIGGIEAVVSHGQTLHHWVDASGTRGSLQIGQPAWIAERLGMPVVFDVRAADIAAGGLGAPLMAFFDGLWLADAACAAGRPVVTVNLGGIANAQIVHPDGTVLAGDTGPANGLLDAVIQRASDGRTAYDADGAVAAQGTVDDALLAALCDHEHFAAPLPKTTGRETFSLAVVDAAVSAVGHEVSTPDLMATLTALTARTLATAITERVHPSEVILSGGGVRNATLVRAIRAHLPETPVLISDERGIPADAREAVMFAVLGWSSLHGVAVTVSDVARIAGSVTLAAGIPTLPRIEAIRAIDVIGAQR